MKKAFLLTLLIFFITRVNGQAPPCNCQAGFRYIIKTIKENYAGFYTKTAGAQYARYQKLTDSLVKAARNLDEVDCYFLLNRWFNFFADGHTFIHSPPDSLLQAWAIKNRNKFDSVQIPKDQLPDYARAHATDSLTGVWMDEAGNYVVGIIKTSAHAPLYTGYIIRSNLPHWFPGQVKFYLNFSAPGGHILFQRNHQQSLEELKLTDSSMLFRNINFAWRKLKKGEVLPDRAAARKTAPPAPGPVSTFKVVDKNISVLTLPSFLAHNHAYTDSLIHAHRQNILNSQTLIVDVRGNFGGSILVYDSLVQYFYTNPIIRYGGNIRAGSDVVAIYEEYVKDSLNTPVRFRSGNLETLTALKQNRNKTLNLVTGDTIQLPAVYPNPSRVYILMDRNCFSATELLVISALQSKKVKLFGENTGGSVDYLDISPVRYTPCKTFSFQYGTYERVFHPIGPKDNIGFEPHIRIPATEKDWLDFVIRYAGGG